MPQGWDILFHPISSYSFLGHYIKIPIFKINHSSLSDWLALQEPLIMNWLTFPSGQPDSDDFFTFSISMEPNAALFHIKIVVSFSFQLLRSFKVFAKILSDNQKQGNFFPIHYASSSVFIIGFLRLITKAKIMTSMFRYDSSIHKCLGVPIKTHKLMHQCLLVDLNITQQALYSPLHNQNASVFCLLLCELIEIHKMAFVSLILKFLLGLDHLLS